MITLGIETSCDETAVAVLKGRRTVLSSVVASSLKEHRKYGGVVPEIASRAHLEALLPVLDKALAKARLKASAVDLIAVTQGPGLMGSLLVGVSAAKALALALDKPLIGVDHVLAHVYAGFLSDPGVRFPCLGLVVSGGHTMLIRMDAASEWRILGRTLDDAAGEAFDKVAKMLDLGYPGGPEIDRLSRGQDPNRFPFTRPFLSKDSLQFSFSGIKTAVYYAVERIRKKRPLNAGLKKQIASGFQEAVCDVLVHKALLAARQERLSRIVVGGGVSANRRLREKLAWATRGTGIRAVLPEGAYCLDNAAMIAGLGAAIHREGKRKGLWCQVDQVPVYANFKLGPGRPGTTATWKKTNR